MNVRRDPSTHQVRFSKRFARYLEGRNLGDELRYILDRRSALKFPGNMLHRPELLLNPWAIRQTDAEDLRSIAGDDWSAESEDLGRKLPRLTSSAIGSKPINQGAFSNLDFLATAAEVYLNLIPDEKGRLEIPLPADGAHQAYEVVAIHGDQIVSQSVYLPEMPLAIQDLRLPKSLDGEKHFAENKRITEITAGQVLELKSAGTGEMEVFDSLAKVFQLFQTLSGNSALQDFQFILDWPDLSNEERLKKYSEFACHELNFFVYRKDPEFFRAVVLPYLANKREKTFLDHFLLHTDLTIYRQPWHYARLNTAERCFLADRQESEHPMTLSFLQDSFDSQTPDLEKWNRLFQTGLRIGRMENASRRGGMGGGGIGGGAFFGEPLEQAQAANNTSGMAARYGMAKSSLGIDADGLRRSSGRIRNAILADAKRKKAPAPAAKPGLGRGRAGGSNDKQLASDLARRQTIRSYYREAEKTQAWAENHYWKLPKDQQSTGLVGINSFWVDYIQRDRTGVFLSPAIAEAAGSFSEMMLALSVLDLPIRINQPAFTVQEDGSGIRFDSPAITFHKQIREVSVSDEEQNPVLVNQAIFKPRATSGRQDAAKSLDYTNGNLQMRTLYGCEIVVTNPTGEDRKLDILLQIPEGAVPVQNGFYTRSRYVQVLPHTTHRITYFFYFPVPGEFMHFPVHVSSNGNPVASAQTRTITVLESLTEKDTQSWEYIAQEGSMEQVIDFLKNKNLKNLPLDLVAWRVSKKSSYLAITEVLRNRHYFNHDIWAYSLLHKDPTGIEETLLHQKRFINQCGLSLDSPLLQIDPVARGLYQHIEYRPLYNPRIHAFGSKRQILNEQFFLQYKQFLEILSYRSELNQEDLLAIVYYLLLQDRVEEGLHFFNRIDGISPVSKIQFDYLKAYLSFYLLDPEEARRIAESYRDYSVIKWREKFLKILNQVDEIQGEQSLITDEKDRDQRQTQLASTEPDFEFSVDSGKVRLNYQNLNEVSVSYYLMDLEFLFSRNPFLQQGGQRFTFIRPNRMESLSLPEGRTTFSFDLPSDFQNRNILIEIKGGGKRKTQTFYSNDLNVQIVENFGQVKVVHRNSGKPLSKVYVKVYARTENDEIKFHKDGYTDLRGRFDYASLNDGQIGQVSQFAMLILSENNGAVVREFDPPQR
ncbi:MAG TPA: hypothetical protein EYG38_10310 [Verrucomicrobia bacterium]|nr:hypothetical protein [Verrucomicrobiota bacterium]